MGFTRSRLLTGARPDGTANTGRPRAARHGPRSWRADVVGEDPQRAGGQPGHAVGQVAGTAPLDESEQVAQPAQRAAVRAPAAASRAEGHLLKRVGDGWQAVQARAALPGALARQVADHPRRLGQPAAGGGQDEEDARAERRPGRAQRVRGGGRAERAPPGSQLPK